MNTSVCCRRHGNVVEQAAQVTALKVAEPDRCRRRWVHFPVWSGGTAWVLLPLVPVTQGPLRRMPVAGRHRSNSTSLALQVTGRGWSRPGGSDGQFGIARHRESSPGGPSGGEPSCQMEYPMSTPSRMADVKSIAVIPPQTMLCLRSAVRKGGASWGIRPDPLVEQFPSDRDRRGFHNRAVSSRLTTTKPVSES